MYKHILSFLLSHTFVFCSHAQTILTDLTLSNKKINNIQSFDVGDKILLAYDEKGPEPNQPKRLYHIYSGGQTKQIPTRVTENNALFGAITYGKEEYIYYLVDKEKDIALKALKYDDSTNTATTLPSDIVLSGALLATWSANNLHLALYDKGTNEIEVIELNKFSIVSKKRIVAPVDLRPYYKYISYISYDATISIEQGSSAGKIYRDGKNIYITIDKSSYELNNRTPETLVLKFDLDSESSSMQKISFSGGNRFSSFLFRGRIYRVAVSTKSYDVKTFDLKEKKLVDAHQIAKSSMLKDSVIYLRDGKAVRVSKKETLSRMMKVSELCFPSIIVYAEDDSVTTVISGTYYNQKGMGSFAGGNPLASLLNFAITSAIKQMIEPPGISRYTYMTVQNNGENISLRQRIDDYEISLEGKKIFFDYKAYATVAGGVLAMYHDERNDKLTLVLFARDQNSE